MSRKAADTGVANAAREARYVACLDCARGPKGKDRKNLCSCGWQARRRNVGCYLGERIPGTKAKKGEQGYVG